MSRQQNVSEILQNPEFPKVGRLSRHMSALRQAQSNKFAQIESSMLRSPVILWRSFLPMSCFSSDRLTYQHFQRWEKPHPANLVDAAGFGLGFAKGGTGDWSRFRKRLLKCLNFIRESSDWPVGSLRSLCFALRPFQGSEWIVQGIFQFLTRKCGGKNLWAVSAWRAEWIGSESSCQELLGTSRSSFKLEEWKQFDGSRCVLEYEGAPTRPTEPILSISLTMCFGS